MGGVGGRSLFVKLFTHLLRPFSKTALTRIPCQKALCVNSLRGALSFSLFDGSNLKYHRFIKSNQKIKNKFIL
jgi:hypothetical protein